MPHVVTAHSLEPLRPWKAEQLGGGYASRRSRSATAYEGAAAVIAVSAGMRADILQGLPVARPRASSRWCTTGSTPSCGSAARDEDVVRKHGVDPDRPSVVFVGRITRQKGLPYLLRAAALAAARRPARALRRRAGHPGDHGRGRGADGRAARPAATGVVWIPEMLPRDEVVALLSAATVFACPSVYEPLGIVNLEAMACELAVVGHRDRRHPRGRRRRRDRLAGADRPGGRRHRHAGRPRRVRRRPRRRRSPRPCRTRSGRATSGWPAAPAPWSTSPGVDRRPDDRRLRAGPRPLTHTPLARLQPSGSTTT